MVGPSLSGTRHTIDTSESLAVDLTTGGRISSRWDLKLQNFTRIRHKTGNEVHRIALPQRNNSYTKWVHLNSLEIKQI
uniref:F5/8 type C domain-containing protein n=1 Tax=Steinernema glaseri TaxID=37863 RepID=A0A1I7ZU07_9BILA